MAWWRSLGEHLAGLAAAVSLIAVLGVLVSIRRRSPRDAGGVNGSGSVRPAAPRKSASLHALQRACLAIDNHTAASALRDPAAEQWPVDPPLGLGALASRLDASAPEIARLERSLYSAGGMSSWQGETLWQGVRHGLRHKASPASTLDDGLTALYPVRVT